MLKRYNMQVNPVKKRTINKIERQMANLKKKVIKEMLI